jgi:hypothetical protein
MNSANIQTVKLDIISKISHIEDKKILQKVWDLIADETQKELKHPKDKILENIKAGIIEMKSIEKGKTKAKPLKDLLDEL